VGRDWTIFSLIEGTVHFDREGRRINVFSAGATPPGKITKAATSASKS
jgi:Ribosomal L27 protein